MIDPNCTQPSPLNIDGINLIAERDNLREELAKREATLKKIYDNCQYYIGCEDESLRGLAYAGLARIVCGIIEQDA